MKIRETSAAAAFSRLAADYDRWHETSPVYGLELAALALLAPETAGPAVEIGCGTGRFSPAAGIGLGVDPAAGCLAIARARIPAVVRARAEALPLPDGAAGTVFFFFSLCFCDDQEAAVAEAARALRPGGGIVLAIINRESPWGGEIEKKKAQGHPLYRFARLLTPREAGEMLAASGLTTRRAVSCLLAADSPRPGERPRRGITDGAGCVMLWAEKTTRRRGACR